MKLERTVHLRQAGAQVPTLNGDGSFCAARQSMLTARAASNTITSREIIA
jgi:hypothetical protein